MSLHNDRSNIFKHLLSLKWQHTEEYKITFRSYTLIIIVNPDIEFLLEGAQ